MSLLVMFNLEEAGNDLTREEYSIRHCDAEIKIWQCKMAKTEVMLSPH